MEAAQLAAGRKRKNDQKAGLHPSVFLTDHLTKCVSCDLHIYRCLKHNCFFVFFKYALQTVAIF